jgi:predicted nicotinamide N-methyase
VQRVVLPGCVDLYRIRLPVDVEALLDAAAADPEQNLPYWCELWPSGIALAAFVARERASLRGKQVLELGCGLGVTAIAALRAGAELTVSDYAAEALALCALNAIDVTGREPHTVRFNWRSPARDLLTESRERFTVVLAADVLYEERDVRPLLDLVQDLVTPGGELWLAEPGRPPAAMFLGALAERGWTDVRETCAGPWPDPEDNRKGVVVTVHRLRRSQVVSPLPSSRERGTGVRG